MDEYIKQNWKKYWFKYGIATYLVIFLLWIFLIPKSVHSYLSFVDMFMMISMSCSLTLIFVRLIYLKEHPEEKPGTSKINVIKWDLLSIVVVVLIYAVWMTYNMPTIRSGQLSDAVNRLDSKEVKRLLDSGADPNYRDRYNRSMLFSAIRQVDTQVFEDLLDHGAKWNVQESEGKSILTYVLYEGEPYDKLTTLLLKHGAKPDFEERGYVRAKYQEYLQRQKHRDRMNKM